MAYEPKKFSPAELAELHALPDDSLLTAQEAAAFLRLKYGTLAGRGVPGCPATGQPYPTP